MPTGTEESFHLMFKPCAGKLREAEKLGLFDRVAFYVNPEKEIVRMMESVKIQIPIVFRGEANNKIPVQMPDFFEQGALLSLLSIAAVGKQLCKTAERKSYSIGNHSINRLSWLMHKHSIADFTLAADDIRACDPARMVRLLQPQTKEELKLTQLWGKIFFSLPAEIEPDPEKPIETVPGVLELFKAIHSKMPLLPVYFHRPFGQDWLALLAPQEAIVGNQYNILHPKLANMIIDSYEDLLNCGEKLDLNVWLALECLFGDLMEIMGRAVLDNE